MKILGISGLHHDSAACLVADGVILAAAEEERFSRRRHDAAFPLAAIAYCLEQAAVQSAEQIDIVVFHEKPTLVLDRLAHAVLQCPLRKAPRWLRSMAPAWIPGRPGSRLAVEETVRCVLPEFRGKMLYSLHHVSHAASAFFPSPFRDAAILTIDGVGEWVTAAIAHGEGNDLNILRELVFPNSLGLFYAAFTEYVGFTAGRDENETMGLASGGQPSFYGLLRDEVIHIRDDGSIELNQEYLNPGSGGRIATGKLAKLLGYSPRDSNSPFRDVDRDLAASVQKVTEDAVLTMATFARHLTGADKLCVGGGVAFNCMANSRLRREGAFGAVWVQPASGNAGGALGASLAAWHVYLNQPRSASPSDSMEFGALGPSYSSVEIREFLDRFDLPHEVLDRADLPHRAAQLVANGHIVGLLQGRMEFGPRALGNRSVLGDPRGHETQARINAKVKGREPSWPCGSAVLEERAAEWFELDIESKYMSFAAAVSRPEIAGAAHPDGSARPQTVGQDANPVLHAILRAFERITSVPVLLSVSFSGPGEPIVCSPMDAYRCMMHTEIDCIFMEDILVWRHEQPGYEGSRTTAA